MYTICLKDKQFDYDKDKKTFTMSEKGIPFGTTYEVLSPTGNSKTFVFDHSTGPEFSPDTKYVFKSGDLTLVLCNDAQITEQRAKEYLSAKIGLKRGRRR